MEITVSESSSPVGWSKFEQQCVLVRDTLNSQALLVCEASQKRSTVFAASRFACTALYGLLGAAAPAAANFAALAIKHIQHDTITGRQPELPQLILIDWSHFIGSLSWRGSKLYFWWQSQQPDCCCIEGSGQKPSLAVCMPVMMRSLSRINASTSGDINT